MTVCLKSRDTGMVPKLFAGQAFGLHFRCNQEVPELSPGGGESGPDSVVDIHWEAADTQRSPDCQNEASFHFSDDSFYLQLPSIASYRVTKNSITIAPVANAQASSIRAFLLGSAMGALLQMRGLMVLHGSAVAMPDGQAAVFCGHSTAGKSTLAAALSSRGHPALADDITAIRFDTSGNAWCLPGLSRTKLWRDALETLGLADKANATTRVLPEIDKHSLFLETSDRPARLCRFYELQVQDASSLSFHPVTGLDKLSLLLTHSYRPAYLAVLGRQPTLLRQAANLAPRLLASRIVRPRGEKTLESIVGWLEEQWALSLHGSSLQTD